MPTKSVNKTLTQYKTFGWLLKLPQAIDLEHAPLWDGTGNAVGKVRLFNLKLAIIDGTSAIR